jgi:hypothetical protein
MTRLTVISSDGHAAASMADYRPYPESEFRDAFDALLKVERHPRMKVVFTEMQSDWTVASLHKMDYSFEGSGLRRDIRDVIPMKPSEYWKRQCYRPLMLAG